ncbi:DUF3592 domain-containing protein [Rubripirellula reticaptiva]|uniref:DUF3592 domain-containing protein n=1 Tax=Rubripirellula reticaptiva TaxID=2528013 RepID=A0A5C6F1W4_9BACT|nr:DUF3592 domain-containing protein [Rubripirellula reticaptiva]TWU55783.1 hypothetical protein Poly59_20850 [Rubripirellula reticaptiva]
MQRTVGLCFFGIFAIAGLFLGGITLRGLAEWFGGLHWQSVPATAEMLEVDEHRDSDGASYRLKCRYRYQFGARDFISERVSFFEMGSSSDKYPRQLYRELSQANQAGSMTCLVNPSNPSEAVLDGRIQSGSLGFALLFLVTHGSVGIAGLGYLSAAAPPKVVRGRWRLVSKHAGTRRAWLWILILHLVSFATAVTIAMVGIGAGQWGAIVSMVLAAISAVFIFFGWRYAFVTQRRVGTLWLPSDIDDTMGLKVAGGLASGVPSDAVDLEVRWAIPPSDKMQTGAENKDLPSETVSLKLGSCRVEGELIEFAVPELPKPARLSTQASATQAQVTQQATPSGILLEVIGTIGGRGYRDSFDVDGDAFDRIHAT